MSKPRTSPLPGYTEEEWAALSSHRRCDLRRAEQRLAYQRKWASNNREKRNQYRNNWIAKNPDKFMAARQREKESEGYKERKRDWARNTYPRRREAVIASRAKYRRDNPGKVADSQRRHVFGQNGNIYYHQRFQSQRGLCAICGKTSEHTPRSLGLDHNHNFGPKDPRGWRGLLCMYCNAGIGNFMEDISLLGGAARDYLLYWSSPREMDMAS